MGQRSLRPRRSTVGIESKLPRRWRPRVRRRLGWVDRRHTVVIPTAPAKEADVMPQRRRPELSESVSGEPLVTSRRARRTFHPERICAVPGAPRCSRSTTAARGVPPTALSRRDRHPVGRLRRRWRRPIRSRPTIRPRAGRGSAPRCSWNRPERCRDARRDEEPHRGSSRVAPDASRRVQYRAVSAHGHVRSGRCSTVIRTIPTIPTIPRHPGSPRHPGRLFFGAGVASRAAGIVLRDMSGRCRSSELAAQRHQWAAHCTAVAHWVGRVSPAQISA
jgi:hypothetical protein